MHKMTSKCHQSFSNTGGDLWPDTFQEFMASHTPSNNEALPFCTSPSLQGEGQNGKVSFLVNKLEYCRLLRQFANLGGPTPLDSAGGAAG